MPRRKRTAKPHEVVAGNKKKKDSNNTKDHESKSQNRDRLIIGIDFGTTFSGIAYAFTGKDETDVMRVLDWLGLEGSKQPKVPTTICYDPLDQTKFTWGDQKHSSDCLQGVKLLLDPGQTRPTYLPKLSASMAKNQGLPRSIVDITADYIGAMYRHSLAEIEKTVPFEYLSICRKEFVISVPAVWSDAAKDKTSKAALKAGIYPFTLIREPEAAALYTLNYLKKKGLNVGDSILTCDAGGGTVDLISYEISSLNPKLELRELVPCSGGMAGSLGLNMRFKQAIEDLVGKAPFNKLCKTRPFEEAMHQFDLFLVGWFGSSAYLKARLERTYPDIQIIQPIDAWSAIMKGAVLSKLPNQALVKSIQASRHYGASAWYPRDIVLDSGKRTRTDRYDGVTRVERMSWFIERGFDLECDEKLRLPFERNLRKCSYEKQLIFHDILYQSESEIAPRYLKLDNTMRVNCNLVLDLKDIDRSSFRFFVGVDGYDYVKICYDLVVTTLSAMMYFSLEIDGREIGSVVANYV